MGKTKEGYEILMNAEGKFFFGRVKRDGTMSADSVEIDDAQVMNTFAAWFENYCLLGKTDTLWIKNPRGAILVKQVTEEQITKTRLQIQKSTANKQAQKKAEKKKPAARKKSK